MAKNLPANVGDTGSIPDPGRSHMPWSNEAHESQLVKSTCLRAHALPTRQATTMRSPCTRELPLLAETGEKPSSNEDPVQPKIKKKRRKEKKKKNKKSFLKSSGVILFESPGSALSHLGQGDQREFGISVQGSCREQQGMLCFQDGSLGDDRFLILAS